MSDFSEPQPAVEEAFEALKNACENAYTLFMTPKSQVTMKCPDRSTVLTLVALVEEENILGERERKREREGGREMAFVRKVQSIDPHTAEVLE